MPSPLRFPKGSEWRRWDLHAHTPLDHEWINRPELRTEDQRNAFARSYIDRAAARGLSVIGIVDHNFCNTTDDLVLPFIQREARAREITVLPGFELTTTDLGGIHVLLLFPQDTEVGAIDGIVRHLFAANANLVSHRGEILASTKSVEEVKKVVDQAGVEALFIFAHAASDRGVLNEAGGANRVKVWQTDFIRIAQLPKPKHELDKARFVGMLVWGMTKKK